jgi:hypothetical protein
MSIQACDARIHCIVCSSFFWLFVYFFICLSTIFFILSANNASQILCPLSPAWRVFSDVCPLRAVIDSENRNLPLLEFLERSHTKANYAA